MSASSRPPSPAEARRMADQAWSAFVALTKAEKDDPDLRDNPYWLPLKDSAHARFRAIYESEALR